jgi:hypothetical protein
MKLKSRHVAPLVLFVFVAGIGGTMAFNLWRTEGSKIPAKLSSGEHEGEYNPSDIRGSYAFSDISEFFKIPLEDLSKAFGLESVENVGEFRCKELKELYPEPEEGEIGTDSAKLFVSLYTGLPHTPEETTRLPAPALSVLSERLSQEELRKVDKISVSLSGFKPQSSKEAPEHASDQDRAVRGNTTFAELQDWKLAKEEIEQVLGIPMGKLGLTVRDHCTANGIEFGEVKTALQALVDTKKQ